MYYILMLRIRHSQGYKKQRTKQRAVLILYLECRRIFGPHFPFVVKPCRGNARMAKPLLNLRNVRTVQEGTGRRGGTERVRAQSLSRDSKPLTVVHDDVPVNGAGAQALR